jgi:hypothetical protein
MKYWSFHLGLAYSVGSENPYVDLAVNEEVEIETWFDETDE